MTYLIKKLLVRIDRRKWKKTIAMSNFIYFVTWKNQKRHTEFFYDLKIFAESYPRYCLQDISEHLDTGVAIFEDDDVRIEKREIVIQPKPDFAPMFFWEFSYDRIDWNASAATIIQRILERGMPEHWQELKRFYGEKKIISALKEKITYLPDEIIEEASESFNLNKSDMLCYRRKQASVKLWR